MKKTDGLKRFLDYKERFFKTGLPRNFATFEDAFIYLEETVFEQSEFIENVSEAAEYNKVSYSVAYEIITNYLTNVLYEIDSAKSYKRKETQVSLFGYLRFKIGFGINIVRGYLKNEVWTYAKENNYFRKQKTN